MNWIISCMRIFRWSFWLDDLRMIRVVVEHHFSLNLRTALWNLVYISESRAPNS